MHTFGHTAPFSRCMVRCGAEWGSSQRKDDEKAGGGGEETVMDIGEQSSLTSPRPTLTMPAPAPLAFPHAEANTTGARLSAALVLSSCFNK